MRRVIGVLSLVLFIFAVVPRVLADEVHIVSAGENLFRISLQYDVTIDEIMRANGLTGTNIYVGQRLTIPTDGGTAPAAETTTAEPEPPAVTQAAANSGEVQYHTVLAGETLFTIGIKYGLLWTTIQQANGLPSSTVYSGQRLLIPGSNVNVSPAAEGSTPEDAPTAETIVDPTPAPAPTAVPVAAPAAATTTHVVQRGETLHLIGTQYGVSWPVIQQANNLPNTIVYVGQTLTIPAAGTTVAAPVSTAPLGQPRYPGEKYFLVDISEQKLYAYEGEQVVREMFVSTGLAHTPTVLGTYSIYLRYESARMRGCCPAYDLDNVPYTQYFYRGYGLHGTYWHSNFGTPMSHGCVNMPTDQARWAFFWADYGTRVTVQS